MPKQQRHGGRNQRSQGGNAGGGGGNRQGKISYSSGDEPAFIRQFKERTGYKAPATAEDKHRTDVQEYEERRRDGDYRLDEERPQIVQLNSTDLSREEVDAEIAKAKAAEEERKCVDSTGRLLFRKPKEKTDGDEGTTTSSSSSLKSDIVDMASTSTKAATSNKRKQTTTSSSSSSSTNSEAKKTKSQLLSFMDESGIDGDD